MKNICKKIIKTTGLLIIFVALLTIYIFTKSDSLNNEGGEERMGGNQENNEIKDEKTLYYIPNIQNPNQLVWYKNNLLIVKDDKIRKLNTKSREIESIGEIKENQVLSIYQNEIVYVQYENHIIMSPEEYATEIEVISKDEKEKIFSNKYHETIKPLEIKGNKLIVMDNYLNSPEREYKIDLEDGEIKRHNFSKPSIKGEDSIIIIENGEEMFNIPKFNNIISVNINSEEDKVSMIDKKGYIWIYFKKQKDI